MPPHQFIGFTLEEWASIVAIVGGAGAAVGLVVKMTSVMNRLESSIDTLNATLTNLVSDNRDTKKRLNKLEDRLEEHIGEAKVRNTRIAALEKSVFKGK